MNRDFFYHQITLDHRRDIYNDLRDARLLATADRETNPTPKWRPLVLQLAAQAMIAAAILRPYHFFGQLFQSMRIRKGALL